MWKQFKILSARKRFFRLAHFHLSLLLICNCAVLVGASARQPPNILWITAEDMSPKLGCYGDALARTPHIDRLAKEGIRYTRVFATVPVCAPSRSSIITGMYPTTIGSQNMRTTARTASLDKITDPKSLAIPEYEVVPPPEVKCFTEYLRANGYYCTNNSKTDYNFKPPLTAWDENSNKAHWRDRPKGKPFFAVFNMMDTHESKVWGMKNEPLITDPGKVILPPYYPESPVIRRDMARVYDNIALMDEKVGQLLKTLEEDGLLENTIVFFYSDHGDGTPKAKRWVYDSGIKTPLIIRFPGKKNAGTVNGQLISFIDFAPTVLSLAAIKIPGYLQGKAFLGTQKQTPSAYLFASRDRMDPAIDVIRAVRDKRYKYIRNYQPEKPYIQSIPYRDQMELMQELFRLEKEGKLNEVQKLWFRKSKPIEELYDTQADPHEVENIAENPAYRAVLKRMRKVHEKWVKKTNDLGVQMAEKEMIAKMLPGGVQTITSPPVVKQEKNRSGKPGKITINCPTAGASIAYRANNSEKWQLYSEPLELSGSVVLYTKAIRIGYKESKEIVYTQQGIK